MDKIHLNSDLVEINLDLNNKEEVISRLSDHMLKKGFVKTGYKEAVLKREEEFPTGLHGAFIDFAIPHTESKYVNEAAIAVGLLKNKVRFSTMEDYEEEVEVSLVLLLAILNPSKQIRFLQKLIEMMQNEKVVKDLLQVDDSNNLVELLKKNLGI
ncbi:PTS sugar transporter subunit IIA [Iocasia frigidifontis]|uniref:PTS sugar transporter subunit IIA n=1 Tax=Iocasia fonsfrigidae TaxID=2682810 RepID=A0A8A7K7E6_9FIRM|nr:PTS sugar transporter subunit IIA [Iocasia fonsfrigidae]QTL97646.1 PTS sugar transporter subunit IIA [Iocasia fonsfrigidae]